MIFPLSDRGRIYAASFLRTVGVGLCGVLLGPYLPKIGFSAVQVGIVVTAGLGGNALAMLLVSFYSDRFGRRRSLLCVAALFAVGGVCLASFSSPGWVLLAAFFGLVNGHGHDRGPASALEQAVLPGAVEPARRTAAFARYNLFKELGHAVGALAAGGPFLLRQHLGLTETASYRWAFVGYALLGAAAFLCYRGLSPAAEAPGADEGGRPKQAEKVSPEGRRTVAKLCGLFGIDAAAGGLLGGALISYWFFRRFGVDEQVLGPLFFAARLLNAISYLAAAELSRRFGLLNTMVFTHIPSSVFLMAVPFAPTLAMAAVLFLLRESLVEMDVPTRESYVVAVVRPQERTFAAGLTNLTRNLGWSVSPAFAGWAISSVALSFPIFLGGAMKIFYDLLLFRSFRRVRPPEEQGG